MHDKLQAKGSNVKALVAHPGVAPTALHLNSMVGGDTPPAAAAVVRLQVGDEDAADALGGGRHDGPIAVPLRVAERVER